MLSRFSAIAVFALILLFLIAARAGDNPGGFVPANPVGPLPDIAFEDAKGNQLHLHDFRGHPVLLNLWATWCGPCVEEMPSLDRLQPALADQGVIVIALDQERNGLDMTKSFFTRHEIKNLSIYNDPSGRIASQLHSRALPTTFLIDPNGNLNGFLIGSADWSTTEMVKFLKERIARMK